VPAFKYRAHRNQAIHTTRSAKEIIAAVVERNLDLLETMPPDIRRLASARVSRAYRERARSRLMSGNGAGARQDARLSLGYEPGVAAAAYLVAAALPGSAFRILVERGRWLKRQLRR
jgi:hypothetical protein